VVGRVETYQGDTEIEVSWDLEQIQVIGKGPVPAPLVLSTHDVALEENEGWLVQTYGQVVAKTNDYNFFVDDGSGPARVFIDGYNGDFAGVQVGNWATVIGLASEDGNGQRIRVRKPEDVVTQPPPSLSITKSVVPTEDVPLGSVITYTIVLSNSGDGPAVGVVMTDTLPPEVDFGGWVLAGSAIPPGPTDGKIVWGPWDVGKGTVVIPYVFTATLKSMTLYYDIPVTNTVEFTSINGGSGYDEAIFRVEEGIQYIYLPLVTRSY